jgi:hypothetical protein
MDGLDGLRLSYISIISPMLPYHLHVNTTLIRRTSWRIPVTFKRTIVFWITQSIWQECTFNWHRLHRASHCSSWVIKTGLAKEPPEGGAHAPKHVAEIMK